MKPNLSELQNGPLEIPQDQLYLAKELERNGIVSLSKNKKGKLQIKLTKSASLTKTENGYEFLVKPEPVYVGLFFKNNDILKCTSENKVQPKNHHITFKFGVSLEMLETFPLGKESKVKVLSRGVSEENEGLKVQLEQDVMSLYKNPATPHITLGVSANGKAKNTANLEFDIEQTPEILIGTMGVDTNIGVFTSLNELHTKQLQVKISFIENDKHLNFTSTSKIIEREPEQMHGKTI